MSLNDFKEFMFSLDYFYLDELYVGAEILIEEQEKFIWCFEKFNGYEKNFSESLDIKALLSKDINLILDYAFSIKNI